MNFKRILKSLWWANVQYKNIGLRLNSTELMSFDFLNLRKIVFSFKQTCLQTLQNQLNTKFDKYHRSVMTGKLLSQNIVPYGSFMGNSISKSALKFAKRLSTSLRDLQMTSSEVILIQNMSEEKDLLSLGMLIF